MIYPGDLQRMPPLHPTRPQFQPPNLVLLVSRPECFLFSQGRILTEKVHHISSPILRTP